MNPGLLGLAATTVSIASASGRVRFLIRGAIACPVLYYSSMPAGDNAKKEGEGWLKVMITRRLSAEVRSSGESVGWQ